MKDNERFVSIGLMDMPLGYNLWFDKKYKIWFYR